MSQRITISDCELQMLRDIVRSKGDFYRHQMAVNARNAVEDFEVYRTLSKKLTEKMKKTGEKHGFGTGNNRKKKTV
jgi:hypothetical protein